MDVSAEADVAESIARTVIDGIEPMVFQPLWFFVKYLLVHPTWMLYAQGPRLIGRYFFYGRPYYDMCSEIHPGVSSSHWRTHTRECIDSIRRDFQSILVLLSYLIWVFVMLRLAGTTLWIVLHKLYLLKRVFRIPSVHQNLMMDEEEPQPRAENSARPRQQTERVERVELDGEE